MMHPWNGLVIDGGMYVCISFITLVLFGLINVSISGIPETFLTVSISGQKIEGKEMTSFEGYPYLAFQGIPYALPPVGALRFQPPKPLPPRYWTGTLKALTEPPVCPQFDSGLQNVVGSEDCLYLNVYTHADVFHVPVLVYIHGGSFSSGSGGISELGPEYLLDSNLVVVTINYRLGALGFLSTGDATLPGNNGLKDQLVALRWVKTNIEVFGGDANRIMLQGHGAGGASAQFHMLSPMSKGLFHRLMYHGGSALNFWAFQIKPLSIANTVGRVVNCPNTTLQMMMSCIMEKPADVLVRTLYNFPYWVVKPPFPFSPVQEFQNTENDPPFLTMQPEEILDSEVYNHVPTIAGGTHDEFLNLAWLVYENKSLANELENNFQYLIGVSLSRFHVSKHVIDKIRAFYFEGESISEAPIRLLIRLFSDIKMTQGVCRAAKRQVATSYAPVFFYRFTFLGRVSTFMVDGEPRGTCHDDGLRYMFRRKLTFPNGTPNFEERSTILRWGKIISNFASTGNPIPEETIMFPETWPPLGKRRIFRYMDVGNEINMNENPYLNERMQFWDTIMNDILYPSSKNQKDEL